MTKKEQIVTEPIFEGKHYDKKLNARRFHEEVMLVNDDLVFVCPDVENAPWHLQAEVNGQIMNFWPTAMKANVEFDRSVAGAEKINALIDKVRNDETEDLVDLMEE